MDASFCKSIVDICLAISLLLLVAYLVYHVFFLLLLQLFNLSGGSFMPGHNKGSKVED